MSVVVEARKLVVVEYHASYREEMSDLGSVRQSSPPASPEKRGLIVRLFGRT